MLYGMPRGVHRWIGDRFVLASMPPQGLMPRVQPEASPELQKQAVLSHAPTGGMPDTGGGSGGFSAPSEGGRGMGNVSLASLAPDKPGLASMAGGVLGSLAGPITGIAGSALGGLAGGMGTGRAMGGLGGAGLGFLAAGPVGAVLGGLIGSGIGRGIDGKPGPDIGQLSASGDMTFSGQETPAPMYEGPMTLEPAIGGAGLGGIGYGATGPMGTLADGTPAGYGALGTDSSSSSDTKIVCTAMCQAYGFGSFRQKLWLAQSRDLAPEYQRGYHLIFGPLVERAYRENGPVWLRSVLEHIARHRTADIWQQKRGKRDRIGAIERAVLEPLCYAVGWLSTGAKRVSDVRD